MSEPILRPWRRSDAEALRDACRSAPDLHPQFGELPPDSLIKAQDFIEHALIFEDHTRNWAVVADGTAVGNVGISAIEWRHETAWAHYWLAPTARGQGWATRGLATAATWAFEEGLFRLELGHRVTNPASCQVATRAGFRPEGIERQKLRYGDERFDVELHARLATDPEVQVVRLRFQ